jgi:enamine deaminase RidA (YjgF/YER057c/UK114 family)
LPALMLIAGPIEAGERQRATVLMSENANVLEFQKEWGFSDAVITGDTIYVSGVVVGLREGETDTEAAFDRTYKQVGAILARAGAGWDDVVDITSFHTDIVTQAQIMSAVQKRYIKAPFPAWTAIDVDRLIPERGITEIKFVAKRPASGTPARN